jgi:hypothetical protein
MNVCEARQGSAQSAMTQAKKQTLNQSMEQSIKQSVRELWSVGVTIQHGSTLESKWQVAVCSLDRIASKCWCWGKGSLRRPTKKCVVCTRKYIVWSTVEEFCVPGTWPVQIPSRFPVAVPGPESSRGSAGRTITLCAASCGDPYCTHFLFIPSGERASQADLVTVK